MQWVPAGWLFATGAGWLAPTGVISSGHVLCCRLWHPKESAGSGPGRSNAAALPRMPLACDMPTHVRHMQDLVTRYDLTRATIGSSMLRCAGLH
jgi:hypothetical protein